MIAIPPSSATARLALPAAPARTAAARLLGRLAVAAALALAAPSAAHAAQGGVSLGGPTQTKAKGAQATTSPAPTTKPRSVNKNRVRRAQILLRVNSTGSNDTKTRKVVKRFQELRGITTHGIIDAPTYLQIKGAFALLETGGTGIDLTTPGTDTPAPTTADPLTLPLDLAPITPTEQTALDTIAACESGGDPTAISANRKYRGKYQFDLSTWKTVGGTGNPATAPELEQDQRAAILLRQRGTAPWPTCGRDAL